MDKFCKNILDISTNNYEYLINLENVHGVGLGHKWINGINTFEPCIHVLVNKKIDNKHLSSNNIIPKYFMGIKTDVIETGKLKLTSGVSIPNKYRPLQSGCRIFIEVGEFENEGTLGCIVYKKKFLKREYFILSNNHVIANINSAPIGTKVFQTDYIIDSIEDDDVVAMLSNFVPIKFSANPPRPVNYVDCAIARISNKALISSLAIDIGNIRGVDNAVLNEDIKKVGFKTALTKGKITTIGATDRLEISDTELALFKNQMFSDIYIDEGDSGSIVLNSQNKAIGLIMGSGDKGTIINDINIVLSKLNVEIYKST